MVPDRWLIVTGNPADGMEFLGPFDDSEQANDYADTYLSERDWWIVPLTYPEGL